MSNGSRRFDLRAPALMSIDRPQGIVMRDERPLPASAGAGDGSFWASPSGGICGALNVAEAERVTGRVTQDPWLSAIGPVRLLGGAQADRPLFGGVEVVDGEV